MAPQAPTLHLICGKIAAGKSTLAAALATAERTVLISEDLWLSALYGPEMTTGRDYLTYSERLRGIMKRHVAGLLEAGVSVVLDFPANTRDQRGWMGDLVAETGAAHALHHLDVPDAVCLERLHARNAAGVHPFRVSEEQFHRFTAHFEPPSPDEGFHVLRHTPET